MASSVEIGSLIDRVPAIRSGRPKIAGTGLTVRRIVGWYKAGMAPEETALEYPHLTLAQVHAALAYYHANREEIETGIAGEEEISGRPEGSERGSSDCCAGGDDQPPGSRSSRPGSVIRAVLYTFNVANYCILPQSWVSPERLHAGIIVSPQQRYPVGQELRLLMRLASGSLAEEMRNRIEFLPRWS